MPTKSEKEAVKSHLLDYADECNFQPILCRDYGSRARGLSSGRSDYDAFFIFAQPAADYALGGATETYTKEVPAPESLLDTEIELHGWNLRRFVGNDGLAGSNPTAIELCLSTETYFSHSEDGSIHMPLMNMCQHAIDNFKPYALMNHYRSLAASNYGKYIEGDYKLASDKSYSDLLTYGDPPWGGIQEDAANHLFIDEQDTKIGTDQIDLTGRIEWSLPCGTISTDRALERDLIEPTTTDPTVKRHLNVAQALIRARYIEDNHQVLTMWFPDLLAKCCGSEWLPGEVYAEIGELMTRKRHGKGELTIRTDWELHDWIENQLSRDIEPAGHVERQPDTETIREYGRTLYENLDQVST